MQAIDTLELASRGVVRDQSEFGDDDDSDADAEVDGDADDDAADFGLMDESLFPYACAGDEHPFEQRSDDA